MHWWSSGRIVPCHDTDPGSIPGQCTEQAFGSNSWEYQSLHVISNVNIEYDKCSLSLNTIPAKLAI